MEASEDEGIYRHASSPEASQDEGTVGSYHRLHASSRTCTRASSYRLQGASNLSGAMSMITLERLHEQQGERPRSSVKGHR